MQRASSSVCAGSAHAARLSTCVRINAPSQQVAETERQRDREFSDIVPHSAQCCESGSALFQSAESGSGSAVAIRFWIRHKNRKK